MVHIRDVIEHVALRIPEARSKRSDPTFKGLLPASILQAGDPESVQPKRLDFDGLADARSHDPIPNAGIHPRELGSRDAASQETICFRPDTEASTVAVALEDGCHRIEETFALAVQGH